MTANTINAVGLGLKGASGTGMFAGTTGAVLDLSNASGLDLTTGVTNILPFANGGTNVNALPVAPGASAFAAWDVNVNMSANAFIAGYATTVTSESTTTLVVGSAQLQYFTGSMAQDVAMPDVTTLVLGQQFTIVNSTSTLVTVVANDSSVIQEMAAGTQLVATCISITDESNAGWSIDYNLQSGAGTVTSVAMSVPAFLSVSGSPITSSGTLAVSLSGTALPAANGGSGVSDPTAHGILVAEGSSPFATKVLTDGQVLIGHTGADPASAQLGAGTGIAITNGSGSITISATGSGAFVWSVISSSQTIAPFNGYICSGPGALTLTLPATSNVGDTFAVTGVGAQNWTIAQHAGQNLIVSPNSTTVGTGGYIESENFLDSVMFVCTVASTTWQTVGAPQSQGLTIV